MKVPFVSFLPMERELDAELRASFDRVYARSWYIEGQEDEAFEQAFAAYCGVRHCVGVQALAQRIVEGFNCSEAEGKP